MAVGDAYVFPGFLTPVLSHRLLFSHASAEVKGGNMPVRKIASTGGRTHNQLVMSPTCSPLSHPGGAPEKKKEKICVFENNVEQYSLIKNEFECLLPS